MNAGSEIWRPIPGLAGYEASSLGRIRSSWHRVKGGRRGEWAVGGAWKILRTQASASGHLRVFVGLRKLRGPKLVHRLVMAAFSQPEEGKPWVLHKDGNPQNNRLENLKWGTPSENTIDAVSHGTHKAQRGKAQRTAKLDEDQVRKIRADYGTLTQNHLAARHKVSRRTIQRVLSGAKWGWVV